MAGKFLHGAFVQFMQTFLRPLPNVIVFQFNPETMTHTWTPAQPAGANDPNTNQLAIRGTPGESFSFTLAVDANDMIADGSPVAQGIATASGVYTRLAALEMLLHPQSEAGGASLLGSVSVSLGSGISFNVQRDVPTAQLPTVLFVWGPGRILPVKVNTLTITEKLYDPILLNPTHAEAQIGLQVLTPEELNFVKGPLAAVAKVAYIYSHGLRQTLATTNLANSAESIIGMLPV